MDLWNAATDLIEAGRELFDDGNIDIDDLATNYETSIQLLLQHVRALDSSQEKIEKQIKIGLYLTAFEELREQQKSNKPIYNYNYKNMDPVSIWLQNKQFLSETTQNNSFQVESLQSQIITELFGSFEGLLQSIIKQQYFMTGRQQIKLNKILTNHMASDIDERDTINNKLSLIELPDDCLSYTMQFLDNYGRGTIRRCCKSLAIIVAKPCSILHTEDDLIQIIGSNIYIPKIATLISSDIKRDNILGIKLFNEHIIGFNDFNSLRNYDENIVQQLECILNTNYKNLECQEATTDIMTYQWVKCCNLFNVMKYILQESDMYEWRSSLLKSISEWIFYPGFVYDAFKCDGFLDIILNYTVKGLKAKITSDDDDTDDDKSLAVIINGIISKRYTSITNYMLKQGLLDKICYFMDGVYLDEVNDILQSLSKQNIANEYIGDIIENKDIMEYLIKEQDVVVCENIMNNIIKCANHDQRLNIIYDYDVTDEMKAILNSLDDTKQRDLELTWCGGTEILSRKWMKRDDIAIEYDSDPEHKQKDNRSHIHKGIILNVTDGKIVVKDENGSYGNYELTSINIKLPPPNIDNVKRKFLPRNNNCIDDLVKQQIIKRSEKKIKADYDETDKKKQKQVNLTGGIDESISNDKDLSALPEAKKINNITNSECDEENDDILRRNCFITIDDALDIYYKQMEIHDYKNRNGIGKFLQYVRENRLDEGVIARRLECGKGIDLIYTKFDDNFPLSGEETDQERQQKIMEILEYCRKYGTPPTVFL